MTATNYFKSGEEVFPFNHHNLTSIAEAWMAASGDAAARGLDPAVWRPFSVPALDPIDCRWYGCNIVGLAPKPEIPVRNGDERAFSEAQNAYYKTVKVIVDAWAHAWKVGLS